MVFHLVTPNEQSIVGDADNLHGSRGDEGPVEEGGDAGEEVVTQVVGSVTDFGATRVGEFAAEAAPFQSPAEWEREAVGVVEVADHGRHLGQVVADRAVLEGGEHVGAFGSTIIIGAPYGIGTLCERNQESVCESASATKVGFAGQIYAPVAGDLSKELFDGRVGAIVHHNNPVHWSALLRYHFQRGSQEFYPVMGDNNSGDFIGGGKNHGSIVSYRAIEVGTHGAFTFPWAVGKAALYRNFAFCTPICMLIGYEHHYQ